MNMKKITALVLAVMLAVSLCALPVNAKTTSAATDDPSKLPTIFMHGFLGWGAYDDANALIPYFGMTSGSIIDYLNSKGYDTYAPSTGPFSSCWDRVCELYAQLTGTRTDYGIAHSKKYGHDRYGKDFTGRPLIKDFVWDADHPINLVGHSFGGAMSRTFVDMLVQGRPEEVEAAKAAGEKVNPLFEGGKKGYIHSVTMLEAPSNGSSCINSEPPIANGITSLAYSLTNILDLTPIKGFYDTDLEHFGIYGKEGESFGDMVKRVMYSDFSEHHDSCLQDLTIVRACDMNKELEMQPDIYYFTYYGNRTRRDPVANVCVPTNRLAPLLWIFAPSMGSFTGYTEDYYYDGYGDAMKKISTPSQYLGEDWQASDGLVNVASGYCPYYVNDAGERVYDPHVDVADGTQSFKKGIWNIFPERDFDHLGMVGGLLNENPAEVMSFYDEVMANIANTAKEGDGREEGCPSAKMTDVPVNAWFHEEVDNMLTRGVMTGTSATTFSPNANLTRGQIVQMLYAQEGKPAAKPSSFKDVSPKAWYADAVGWASEKNLVAGFDKDTFAPEADVTREQLATILKTYAAYAGKDTSKRASLAGFKDAGDVSGWAYEGMKWAVGSGLIAGRGNKMLAPGATATRAEVAQIMTNFLK